MISTELARRLRDAGLRWHPASGDAFRIDSAEFESDVFTVSEMTIEAHEFDTGTILGFNGTTEWALDSVAIERALWLPREDQLRERLGAGFSSLTRSADGRYRVLTAHDGRQAAFDADDPAQAYALALLALIVRATAPLA
ncbi:MAG: pilus assembly protein CpaE [Microbacteriaceae bacterium]|nr:MAG: pilus assembly protein CpaE [Microbacteriaceae bacterium]